MLSILVLSIIKMLQMNCLLLANICSQSRRYIQLDWIAIKQEDDDLKVDIPFDNILVKENGMSERHVTYNHINLDLNQSLPQTDHVMYGRNR